MKYIIYPNEITISIVNVIDNNDIENIAKNFVPTGKPYKIINNSDIPDDLTFRNAWTYNFDNPDGYGVNDDIS